MLNVQFPVLCVADSTQSNLVLLSSPTQGMTHELSTDQTSLRNSFCCKAVICTEVEVLCIKENYIICTYDFPISRSVCTIRLRSGAMFSWLLSLSYVPLPDCCIVFIEIEFNI